MTGTTVVLRICNLEITVCYGSVRFAECNKFGILASYHVI